MRSRVEKDVAGTINITEYWNEKGTKIKMPTHGTYFGHIWFDGLISASSSDNMSFEDADIVVFSENFDWHIEVSIDMNIFKAFTIIEQYVSVAYQEDIIVLMISTFEEHLAKRIHISSDKKAAKNYPNDLTQRRLF
jgi:hypothetical protein